LNGNFIGLNAAGTAAVGHGSYGVVIDAGSTCVNNHIGGSTPASRNVIAVGTPT